MLNSIRIFSVCFSWADLSWSFLNLRIRLSSSVYAFLWTLAIRSSLFIWVVRALSIPNVFNMFEVKHLQPLPASRWSWPHRISLYASRKKKIYLSLSLFFLSLESPLQMILNAAMIETTRGKLFWRVRRVFECTLNAVIRNTKKTAATITSLPCEISCHLYASLAVHLRIRCFPVTKTKKTVEKVTCLCRDE